MTMTPVCEMCGEHPADGRMIGLNRYAVSRSLLPTGYAMIEWRDGGEYVWDRGRSQMSSIALCFPSCIVQWLEGDLLSLEIELAKPADGGA